MALFSFGKKDKNPPETPASVAKAPPTPPKIQNPPAAGATSSVPSVKPPQPSGLIPTTGISARAAATQPMVMPRGQTTGLKSVRPGVTQSTRSTQRIVLPASASGGKVGGTKPLSVATPTGRINLPIGMILRCLPPEVLAADLSEFESSGAAATEIGLPMNMILGQLPSGKVEIALQDLVPHFPSGYLQPTDSIASYLPTLINLPLMDVVMRIPPDLLSLRPDQKDVDAAVINMADPFTEEILREQAEAARQAAANANIIEENQVSPTEEFVPQAQATLPIPTPPATANPATAAKSSLPLPLPRSAPMPIPPQRQPTSSLPKPNLPAPTAFTPAPPMPSAHPLPTPSAARPASAAPPASPNSSSRTISPSGRLPTPSRATTPIPTRPPFPTPPAQSPMTNQTVPMPPSNRPTASVPVPPPTLPPQPSITASSPVLPVAPPPPEGFSRHSPTGSVAMPPLPPAIVPEASMVATAQPTPGPQPVVASSAPSDDLARLASLAMQQMGESADEQEKPNESVQQPAPEASSAPVSPEPAQEEAAPVASVEPEPAPLPVPVELPKPVASAEPLPQSYASAKPATVPLPPLTDLEQPKNVPQPSPPQPQPTPEAAPSAAVALNINSCSAEELTLIPGCTRELAASIIHYRTKIHAFKKLEDLLEVPGMTKTAYTNLTGELPPSGEVPQTLNELLGFPPEQTITLKDVTDRIACWPDVTGCVLSQSSGLALVGSVPLGLDKSAIVAFVPRMFEAINKSFGEITGKETDELIIPTTGTSFNILRNKDLFLIILSRMPLMPERHLKVARFVLAGLSIREN